MPLLSSEEACDVAGAFLFTLYGSQTFSRWKELKSRMSFITEKEYVDWLLDVANHYEQEGVLERFKYEESQEKSTNKVKLKSTSSVPLLTSREACFGADAFLFTLYGGRTFSRWKEVKLRMKFHNEKEYVECLLDVANHYEHPDAVYRLKKESKGNASKLRFRRRNNDALHETGEQEEDDDEFSSLEDPASDNEDGDYKLNVDTIENPETSSADVKRGVKSRRQKQFICKYCKYKSVLRLDCVRHIRSVHEQFKIFPCPHCKKKMGRKDHLKQHVVNKHKDATTYDCCWCHSNDMHTLTEYLIHISKCESKPRVPLTEGMQPDTKIGDSDVPGQQSTEQTSVQMLPAAKTSTPKPRKRTRCKCEHCGKEYTDRTHVERHIRSVHEGVRKFMCDQCGRKLDSITHLQRHVRSVHERLRPFLCEHCPYRGATNDNLRQHMIHRHQLRTPYMCHQCAKFLPTPAQYKTHVLKCKGKPANNIPEIPQWFDSNFS